MKVDSERSHLFLSDEKKINSSLFEMTYVLSSTCREKLLGIKTDNKLTSEEHVKKLCKKSL